jgi:hypothetical protein
VLHKNNLLHTLAESSLATLQQELRRAVIEFMPRREGYPVFFNRSKMSASSRSLPPSRERFGWFFHGGAHNGPFKLWPAAIQRSPSGSMALLLSSSWRSLDFFDITGLPDK